MSNATRVSVGEQMVDIVYPTQEVEISISDGPDGLKIWVNVDGVCRLRISNVADDIIKLDDKRLSNLSDQAY